MFFALLASILSTHLARDAASAPQNCVVTCSVTQFNKLCAANKNVYFTKEVCDLCNGTNTYCMDRNLVNSCLPVVPSDSVRIAYYKAAEICPCAVGNPPHIHASVEAPKLTEYEVDNLVIEKTDYVRQVCR
ncbi:MAG: hypothetical protein K2X82_13775 [Gemmataceae bacterium]|nr:hypothetical protein [Gemmataceae bacterium]